MCLIAGRNGLEVIVGRHSLDFNGLAGVVRFGGGGGDGDCFDHHRKVRRTGACLQHLSDVAQYLCGAKRVFEVADGRRDDSAIGAEHFGEEAAVPGVPDVGRDRQSMFWPAGCIAPVEPHDVTRVVTH